MLWAQQTTTYTGGSSSVAQDAEKYSGKLTNT